MAKMTLATLKSFVASYVAAAKQAGAWAATTDSITNLLDKIGQQVTIDGSFQDKLPELDGNDLPLGKTVEEWFVDLTLPKDYDPTGANTLAPHYPTFEEAAYSYTLGRKVIKTSVPYNNVERAAITSEDAANMIAKIVERLTNSESLYRYNQKKQLLGNAATKAVAATVSRGQVLAIPKDTATSEAFITQVKEDVEAASFASEGTSIGGTLIGAAPSLTLYVKKGVMPVVEVQALAGAFHTENLALPANVKVVDDFGSADSKIYAILLDPRGVKLHRDYQAIRTNENGEGDFINYFDHTENTGFISKNTFIKVYKSA